MVTRNILTRSRNRFPIGCFLKPYTLVTLAASVHPYLLRWFSAAASEATAAELFQPQGCSGGGLRGCSGVSPVLCGSFFYSIILYIKAFHCLSSHDKDTQFSNLVIPNPSHQVSRKTSDMGFSNFCCGITLYHHEMEEEMYAPMAHFVAAYACLFLLALDEYLGR
ncbi:hypothetical protein VNO78_34188 [Psophocarpus tetragonolobus]|uniref:Uncharacterized protein n=1 Tax=Psophocarpus tetragonolobus TaxID=3891 RepID=A0AAN9NZD9_PSOTE